MNKKYQPLPTPVMTLGPCPWGGMPKEDTPVFDGQQMREYADQNCTNRLRVIAAIIEAVDNRCMAADGPVTPTLKEMTQAEISRIYALATSGAVE